MFTHVTNLAHKRSITDALGFYVFFTVLLVGLSTFAGHYLGILGVVDGVGTFFEGSSFHTLVGTGWVLMLSGMILNHKKLTDNLLGVILAMVGIYLAYTTNVMLGMVVVAYLTTLDKK